MMQSFLQQEGHQIPQESMPQPFFMEQMRRDLDGYRTSSPRPGSNEWAAEFDPGEKARMEAAFQAPKAGGFVPTGFTPSEFQRFEMMQRNSSPRAGSPAAQNATGMNRFQRPMGMGYGMNMGTMGGFQRPIDLHPQPSEQTAQSKGKGRMVELDDKDWEAQFAEMDKAGQELEVDAEANAAIETELDQMDRSVLPDTETDELGDFESIWRGIQAETAENRTLNGVLDNDELGLHMGENTLNDINTWDSFDSDFADLQNPRVGNYTFEENNPFTSTANPYEEGLKIVREGGNLSLAALAFEAAVKQDPDHIEAWSQLGSAQAQNEKETPAIRALEQTIKLDPTNLPALMGLAISYTNEGYDSTAYRTLERWLSTKYPSIIPPSDTPSTTAAADMGFTDRTQLHEKVTGLFIRAAQLSPGGTERMDPDVQVGLGVLFYGAEEYSKAVDCFEAALASTEEGTSNASDQAHLLWNRLGATLANSGRPEEAIDAYEKALTLNPNFVRARYNLGVSCINIGVYEQAAQHLLGALSMHRVVEREGMERVREVVGAGEGQGPGLRDGEIERMVSSNQSTNLLETLRRVFGNMGRRDLAEKVEVGMDVEAFRGEFDF